MPALTCLPAHVMPLLLFALRCHRPQCTSARSQENKATELRRKSNTGKRSKTGAAPAPAAARPRLAPAQAPSPPRIAETPTKRDKRAPVETVTAGSPGGGVSPDKDDIDLGLALSIPLSALSDPTALLGPPPRGVSANGNSSQKKVQQWKRYRRNLS